MSGESTVITNIHSPGFEVGRKIRIGDEVLEILEVLHNGYRVGSVESNRGSNLKPWTVNVKPGHRQPFWAPRWKK